MSAKSRQIPLDLPHTPSFSRSDFLLSDSNRAAFATVTAHRSGALALTGPLGSGKTHLAGIWQAETGSVSVMRADLSDAVLPDLMEAPGIVVEHADAEGAEEQVFHLLNHAANSARPVLLTGQTPPAFWPADLPDLQSRLSALALARIGAPDDALLAAVLVKLFADRQIAVKPEIIAFLTSRMERSLDAARTIVAQLDRLALSEKRAVSMALVKRLFAD